MKNFLIFICVLLITVSGCSKEPAYQEMFDLGVKYLSEGNYEEAILTLNEAIKIDNKNVDAYLMLKDAYLANNQPYEAMNILDEALVFSSSDELQNTVNQLHSKYVESAAIGNTYELGLTNVDELMQLLEKLDYTDSWQNYEHMTWMVDDNWRLFAPEFTHLQRDDGPGWRADKFIYVSVNPEPAIALHTFFQFYSNQIRILYFDSVESLTICLDFMFNNGRLEQIEINTVDTEAMYQYAVWPRNQELPVIENPSNYDFSSVIVNHIIPLFIEEINYYENSLAKYDIVLSDYINIQEIQRLLSDI